MKEKELQKIWNGIEYGDHCDDDLYNCINEIRRLKKEKELLQNKVNLMAEDLRTRGFDCPN